MAKSYVPVIVPALKAMFGSAITALDKNSLTYIGAPSGGDLPAKFCTVAYANDDQAGVTVQRTSPQWGNTPEVFGEIVTVINAVTVASGDNDSALTMTAAQELFEVCANAVHVDPYLGGVINPDGKPGLNRADLGAHEWWIQDAGEIVTVVFQVVVNIQWGQP
jgi:hypothetical protein